MTYQRDQVLGKFHFLSGNQKAATPKLLRDLGFRAAIRVVSGTVRELQRMLDLQRQNRADGLWYYDMNFHLNIAHALECERKLKTSLARQQLAEREAA